MPNNIVGIIDHEHKWMYVQELQWMYSLLQELLAVAACSYTRVHMSYLNYYCVVEYY